MYTTHTPFWDAKNRFGLPDELPLDFKEIAHIIQTPTAQPQTVAPAHASKPIPTQIPASTSAPLTAPVEQASLEDVEPVSANPPDGSPWIAERKTWLKKDGIVREFLKGEQIPFNLVQNGTPATEQEYKAFMKSKAQKNIKTSPVASADSAGEYQEPDMRIPKKLRDLMIASQINEWEIKDLVGAKGYFPADMPVADYPPEFIDGWCIGYWDQVKTSIMEIRQKQAYEFK